MSELLSHLHFGSVADAWEYADRPIADPVRERRRANDLGVSGVSWLGVQTHADVRRAAADGWPDGAQRVRELAEQIRAEIPRPRSIRRAVKWSDQGDALDMPRVWTGQLDRAWESHPRQSRTGIQSLTIGVNLGQNCSTDADAYFWRGAAAMVLADVLTEAGYNVGIIGTSFVNGLMVEDRGALRAYSVQIKMPDQPLDLNALAASACLCGFFRSAIFSAFHVHAAELRLRTNSNLGQSPEGLKLDQANAALKADGWNWDLSTAHVATRADAIRWLKSAVENVELGQLEALAAL